MKTAVIALTIGILLLTSSVYAKKGKSPIRSTSYQYDYHEVYPKEKTKLDFNAYTNCSSNSVSVQEYEHSKQFPDNESGKLVEVRVRHIYVKFMPSGITCDGPKSKKLLRSIEIPSDPLRMTHIHITFDANLTLESQR